MWRGACGARTTMGAQGAGRTSPLYCLVRPPWRSRLSGMPPALTPADQCPPDTRLTCQAPSPLSLARTRTLRA